jgi:hypothetical protein
MCILNRLHCEIHMALLYSGYPMLFENNIYGEITTSLKTVVSHGRPKPLPGECNTVSQETCVASLSEKWQFRFIWYGRLSQETCVASLSEKWQFRFIWYGRYHNHRFTQD